MKIICMYVVRYVQMYQEHEMKRKVDLHMLWQKECKKITSELLFE